MRIQYLTVLVSILSLFACDSGSSESNVCANFCEWVVACNSEDDLADDDGLSSWVGPNCIDECNCILGVRDASDPPLESCLVYQCPEQMAQA